MDNGQSDQRVGGGMARRRCPTVADVTPATPVLDRRRLLRSGLSMAGCAIAASMIIGGNARADITESRASLAPGRGLRLLSSDSVPLKSYIDNRGQPAGFAIDLAQEVARRAGFVPQLDLMPWTRALVEGRRGTGVIAAIFRTPEREPDFLFTTPLFQDEVVVVVPRGMGFAVRSPADLAGKRVAGQNGAHYGGAFSSALPMMKLEADNDPAQRLRKIAYRHLDCALFNPGRAAVLHTARQAGISTDEFDILPTPLTFIDSHLAVSRTRPDAVALITALDHAIRSVRADGTVDALMRRYLS